MKKLPSPPVTDPLGQVTSYTWHGNRVCGVVDANGHDTHLDFTTLANRTQSVSAHRLRQRRHVLDHLRRQQRVGAVINPRSYAATLTWDGYDRTVLEDAADQRITFTYNDAGQLETQENEEGHTTTLEYDAVGNVRGARQCARPADHVHLQRLRAAADGPEPRGARLHHHLRRLESDHHATVTPWDRPDVRTATTPIRCWKRSAIPRGTRPRPSTTPTTAWRPSSMPSTSGPATLMTRWATGSRDQIRWATSPRASTTPPTAARRGSIR